MLDLKSFEEKIHYHFNDPVLAERALTHRSFAYEHAPEGVVPLTNERLEFLGDAVLELASTDRLYRMFPDYDEGRLSKMRASLVCEEALSECAIKIGLGDHILLGKGEDRSGGRTRPSILSDALEAVIGAIYLDGGTETAREFILTYIIDDPAKADVKGAGDAKSALQEWAQAHDHRVSYHVIAQSGPDHDKEYTVEVQIDGTALGSGTGGSKKHAEQKAAAKALTQLKD